MKILKVLIIVLLLFSSLNIATSVNKVEAKGNIKHEKTTKEPYKQIEKKEKKYLIRFSNSEKTEKFLKNQKDIKNKKKLKNRNTVSALLTNKELANIKKESDISLIEEDGVITSASYGQIDQSNEDIIMNENIIGEVTPWGISILGINDETKDEENKKIKTAIFDTGISKHSDLKISGGISFVDGNYNLDENGHGTHVTGVINGQHNGKGVRGIAPNNEVYSVQVLDENGRGNYSNIIQGIDWAIENDINIISMSLGGTSESTILEQAIQKAVDNGILIVTAAGNYGLSEGVDTETYPAKYSDVLSVGAVNKSLERAEFSSVGSNLDIVAPGVDILSTIPNNKFAELSGTSMATPHVTAAAILIWEKNPKYTAKDIINKIKDTATPLGKETEYGSGVINLPKALGTSNSSIKPISTKDDEKDALDEIKLKEIKTTISLKSSKLFNFAENERNNNNIELAKKLENNYNRLINESKQLFLLPAELEKKAKTSDEIVKYSNEVINYYNKEHRDFESIIQQYDEVLNQYSNITTENVDVKEDSVKANAESDDNQSGATTIVENSTYSSYISTPTDIDWYSFKATKNGSVNVQLIVPSNYDYDIDVLDSNGNVIIRGVKLKGINESLDFNVKANSTYYFKLNGYNGYSTTESYRLILSKVTPSFAVINANEYREISGEAGYEEWYSFTPTVTTDYKISTGPYGGYGESNDTVLEIYSNSSLTSLVASNDDVDSGRFSRIIQRLQAGTTYYLKVRHFNTSTPLYTRLKLEYDTPPISEISLDNQIDLTVGQGESKLYQFTPSQTGKYKIYTSSNGSSSDTYLHLFSDVSLNNQLAYNDDSGSLYSSIEYELQGGTTYYIKFRGYGDNAASAYLNVSKQYTNRNVYVQASTDSQPSLTNIKARDYNGSVYVNLTIEDDLLAEYDPEYYFIEDGEYWFYIHHLSYYFDVYLMGDNNVMMLSGDNPTEDSEEELVDSEEEETNIIEEDSEIEPDIESETETASDTNKSGLTVSYTIFVSHRWVDDNYLYYSLKPSFHSGKKPYSRTYKHVVSRANSLKGSYSTYKKTTDSTLKKSIIKVPLGETGYYKWKASVTSRFSGISTNMYNKSKKPALLINKSGDLYPNYKDKQSGIKLWMPPANLKKDVQKASSNYRNDFIKYYISTWGKPKYYNEEFKGIEIHHMRPLEYGGGNSVSNLIPLSGWRTGSGSEALPYHNYLTQWWRNY